MIQRANHWTFLILIFTFVTTSSTAQLIDIGVPKSWSEKVPAKSHKQIVQMPGFDRAKVLAEDAANDPDKTKPWRFGYNYTVDLDLNNSGEWTELPNGDRIWRLTVRSSGAISINVIFDDFYLPIGSSIHMYNRDRSHLVGAYTDILNNSAHTLGTELVLGEEVTIEYLEPKSSKDLGRLHINTVTHGYRSLNLLAESILKGLNDSGACNIDVFCPLGNGWDDQIKSVGLVIVNGNGGCTGALINNTAGDARPFFLTANHCLGNPSNWFFRFNWHSLNPSCATTTPSGDGPFLQTSFTSTLRASNGGSDFALVELNNPLPSDWDVFFAGWDRTDIVPNFTVGIHHPAGDIKKICRDDDVPTYDVFGGAQVWRIAEWEHGVTEPGSSGSPLFDHNKRIIGQLFGGEAACSNSNPTINNGRYDAYGRFASSWSGNSPNNRLSNWLDPLNTGEVILDGISNSSSGLDIDLALFNVGSPASSICENPLLLNPTVRNLGTTSVTSMTIEVVSNSGTILEYDWSGEIQPGANLTIELPAITLTNGTNALTMSLLNPNGVADENMDNNSQDFTIELVENSVDALLTLSTDCWGSETTIAIYNDTGGEVFSAGPFSDVVGGEDFEFNLCLAAGCYSFTIFDSFGDGINGSAYPSCDVDGDFAMFDSEGNILFQMTSQNGAFEDEETHEFCLENASLVADFTSNFQSICEGGTVVFTDLSIGNIAVYEWEFPGGLPTASTLQNPTVSYPSSGTYPVTLTISDGTSSATITLENYIEVRQSPNPAIEITNNFSCSEDCTGALLVNITEGTGPFDIQWSTGAITETISELCFAPSFTVEVTDLLGCIGRDTINIDATGDLTAEVTLTIDCDNQTACAELLIDGGVEPFDITWSHSDTQELEVCDLPDGSYSVLVSDDQGCETMVEFDIAPIQIPQVSPQVSNETCLDACDGTIVLDVTGSGPFQYSWSVENENDSTLSNLCAGTYAVTIDDANGCESILEYMILPGTEINYELEVGTTNCIENETCVTITFTGDGGPYNILWSTGAMDTTTVCNLGTGMYSLEIINQAGCSSNVNFEVIRLDEPVINAITTEELCKDDCTGIITIEAEGTEPFEYEWSNGAFDKSFQTDLCSGDYSITVTDAIGCESTIEVGLAAGSDRPTAGFEASKLVVSLMDDPNISFTNQSEGATSYTWDFGDGGSSEEASPTHTYTEEGTYMVRLIAANGNCIDIDSVEIMVFMSVSTRNPSLEKGINLYPNPASMELHIDFPRVLASGTVQLINMDGFVLRDIPLDHTSLVSLQIAHLPAGMYVVRVLTKDELVTKRVQIIR